MFAHVAAVFLVITDARVVRSVPSLARVPATAFYPASLAKTGMPAHRARGPVMNAGGAGVQRLIDEIRASSREDLPKILANNMQDTDMRMVFLRLAEMSDEATDEFEKLQIQQLAGLVASTTETLLARVDEQVDQDATTVQELLGKLALPNGEFVLPVPAEQLEQCRAEMQRRGLESLDEGFVATVKAYMQKASDDGLASMVDVLRCLLQTFAAERLRGLLPTGVSDGTQLALSELLSAQPEAWDGVFAARVTGESAVCSAEELVDVLQDRMGEVVLGMPAGSVVQGVIAEYLSELLNRARTRAAEA